MKDKIFELITLERERQQRTLMMIPSENYTYPEVRQAVGSVLSQKYAEGYPHKRYYQGNKFVDEIEMMCQQRALEAFSLDKDKWGVNVQAYSGTPANLAVYNALLEPGEKIMAMFLPEGGHLSHGWEYQGKKITLVSKIWKVEFYHVEEKTRVFDYDKIAEQAKTYRPKLIISGGTAYPTEIDHKRMGVIAKSIGAYYMADIAHEAGLVAAGANTSPFPDADVVTMTTHKTLRGPRGALIFAKKELIEKINASVFPGLQGGPHLHTIAGIAVALEKTKTNEFKDYAKQTVRNAQYLADNFLKAGFDVVGEGTEKHLVLLDMRKTGTAAWYVAAALEEAGIIVNRNTVPFDTGSPFYPSGIRLGTPAVTARGMKEVEMEKIGGWFTEVVNHIGKREIPGESPERIKTTKAFLAQIRSDNFINRIQKEVEELCNKFPVDLD